MVNINNADYQAMVRAASNIEGKGREMNSVILKAYSEVDGLRATWHGTRYNELIELFNEISTAVNELLKVVAVDIPLALSQAAQNYATLERDNITIINRFCYKCTNIITRCWEISI